MSSSGVRQQNRRARVCEIQVARRTAPLPSPAPVHQPPQSGGSASALPSLPFTSPRGRGGSGGAAPPVRVHRTPAPREALQGSHALCGGVCSSRACFHGRDSRSPSALHVFSAGGPPSATEPGRETFSYLRAGFCFFPSGSCQGEVLSGHVA